MIVKKYNEVESSPVTTEGAQKVSIRWLIGKDSGAPNFYLRHFEVEPGGHTPYHSHPFEHEVYVLEGNARLDAQGKSFPLEPGSFALVMPDEEHRFENTGDSTFKFLCLIPDTGVK